MKAAVCREFAKPLVIEELSLLPPEADQILVDITACAICHSDITYAKGDWGGTLPAVYGHEAVGRVRELGSDVKGFKVGDRALVTLIRHCGHCSPCAEGMPVVCDHAGEGESPIRDGEGVTLVQGMATGGFAEQVVVHRSQAITLPDDIPDDVASLLACGVITGVGAVVNAAKVRPGQTVAVIGAGGVGLNVIQGAVIAGASKIIAIDLNETKFAEAKAFGATVTLDGRTPDLPAALRALNNGRGVDYAFVAVGVAAAFNQAANLIAANGIVVAVGMPPSGHMAEYDPSSIAGGCQHIVGSKMGNTVIERDIPWLIELWRQGRLNLDGLISGRYPLEQINEAIEATLGGEAKRNVIVFEGAK